MLYANFILKRFGTILCRYFALFSLHIQFIDISFLAPLCSMRTLFSFYSEQNLENIVKPSLDTLS